MQQKGSTELNHASLERTSLRLLYSVGTSQFFCPNKFSPLLHSNFSTDNSGHLPTCNQGTCCEEVLTVFFLKRMTYGYTLWTLYKAP